MRETPKAFPYRSCKNREDETMGNHAGKSYAYLLGVYLGDGNVSYNGKRKMFQLTTIDTDFINSTSKALKDNSPKEPRVCEYVDNRWSKPCTLYHLQHNDHDLAIRLQNDTGNKQWIPQYVFKYDKETLKQFITGVMDSEGTVAKGYANKRWLSYNMRFKCCDCWISDFHMLCQKIGLQVTKISEHKPYKPHYKTPYCFTIKLSSWVKENMRFNIERKNERVEEWRRLTSETICPTRSA